MGQVEEDEGRWRRMGQVEERRGRLYIHETRCAAAVSGEGLVPSVHLAWSSIPFPGAGAFLT